METPETQAEAPADAANALTPVEPIAESAPAVETPPEPPKDRVQERIDKLTREKYDALRERDALQYRLTSIEERPAPPPPVAPVTVPTLEQYGYDEARYQAAVVAYAESIADRKVTSRLSEWEQKQQHAIRQQTFKQREAEFAAKTEDYHDRVYDRSLPLSGAMAEAIAESDIGPQVAYYLAQNRSEAARIAALSPVSAARELGRIEAKLSAPPEPRVSKAPPPPPRIEASEGSLSIRASEPDSDKLSNEDWLKRREKEIRKTKG